MGQVYLPPYPVSAMLPFTGELKEFAVCESRCSPGVHLVLMHDQQDKYYAKA